MATMNQRERQLLRDRTLAATLFASCVMHDGLRAGVVNAETSPLAGAWICKRASWPRVIAVEVAREMWVGWTVHADHVEMVEAVLPPIVFDSDVPRFAAAAFGEISLWLQRRGPMPEPKRLTAVDPENPWPDEAELAELVAANRIEAAERRDELKKSRAQTIATARARKSEIVVATLRNGPASTSSLLKSAGGQRKPMIALLRDLASTGVIAKDSVDRWHLVDAAIVASYEAPPSPPAQPRPRPKIVDVGASVYDMPKKPPTDPPITDSSLEHDDFADWGCA